MKKNQRTLLISTTVAFAISACSEMPNASDGSDLEARIARRDARVDSAVSADASRDAARDARTQRDASRDSARPVDAVVEDARARDSSSDVGSANDAAFDSGSSIEATWQLTDRLTSTEGSRTFGLHLTLSRDGSRLVVGDADGGPLGLAVIFTQTNGVWDSGSAITRPDSAFGYSVDFDADGTRLAVGQLYDNAITIFDHSNGGWSAGTSLMPTNGGLSGRNVALSADGRRLVAQAYTDEGSTLLTFKHTTSSGWDGGRLLTRTFEGSTSNFALSSDGSTLAVVQEQSLYVYSFRTSRWNDEVVIPAPTQTGRFAGHIAISADGSRIAVVAQDQATNAPNGRVFLYEKSGDAWVQRAEGPRGAFLSMSDDGTRVVVAENNQGSGWASVWSESNGVWDAGLRLPQPADARASRVSISGDGNRVSVGIMGLNGSGSVAIYEHR